MPKIYEIIYQDFKKNYNLKIIKDLKKLLMNKIPSNICEIINYKFFITFNNIKNRKKIVKNKYNNIDDVLNCILKSCFIPYLIDGNLLYENKYVDGFNPYLFKFENNKVNKNKILYLDLFGLDKIGNLLNVKNEKSNFHRILSGLLDIHTFFIKQSSTNMCSFVNNWTLTNYAFYYLKLNIEKIFILILYLIIYIKKYIPDNFKDEIVSKILVKIIHDIVIILLENYCF